MDKRSGSSMVSHGEFHSKTQLGASRVPKKLGRTQEHRVASKGLRSNTVRDRA
ncbi:Bgt-20248 [Blumeria graminis f. sp. tritici]|uniref:Bgt-20248 n=2 Tax=Blumeria graminis f. sp. tritici TaxID=62690 RepID=A0A9X9QE59_BLUGR|nr:Bgt-20248 [Blumeria graminis f. sp. tritici]